MPRAMRTYPNREAAVPEGEMCNQRTEHEGVLVEHITPTRHFVALDEGETTVE